MEKNEDAASISFSRANTIVNDDMDDHQFNAKKTEFSDQESLPPAAIMPTWIDLQVVFGPGGGFTTVSELTGWKCTHAKDHLLAQKFLGKDRVVTCYTVSTHGDQLALFYRAVDWRPGWIFRSCNAVNSPDYQTLKSWLSVLLNKYPREFRNTRVIFGPRAGYYAACNHHYLWHDLPPSLLSAIEYFRNVLTKVQKIKAEPDAKPHVMRLLTDADIDIAPHILKTRASHFDLDNLPTSGLPKFVALGFEGSFVAVWQHVALTSLPESHQIYQMICKWPGHIPHVQSISLSFFAPNHYLIVMDDWRYRYACPSVNLNLPSCLREHAQLWIRLVQFGRKVLWQNVKPDSAQIMGTDRLDVYSDFKYYLESSEGKPK